MLVILGDPGMGKTILVAGAAREAVSAGVRVLAAAGRASEQDLAFAGLYQLLRPVLDRVDDLPVRQAGALRGAFALSEDPAPPDALLTAMVLAQWHHPLPCPRQPGPAAATGVPARRGAHQPPGTRLPARPGRTCRDR